MEGEFEMLVLSRKQEELIRIGDNLILKVVKVQGNRVQLGFEDLNGARTPIVRMEVVKHEVMDGSRD
jgi:carbon storage regulator CsrA